MLFFSVATIAMNRIAGLVPSHGESNWNYNLLTEKMKKLFVKPSDIGEKRIAPEEMPTSYLLSYPNTLVL